MKNFLPKKSCSHSLQHSSIKCQHLKIEGDAGPQDLLRLNVLNRFMSSCKIMFSKKKKKKSLDNDICKQCNIMKCKLVTGIILKCFFFFLLHFSNHEKLNIKPNRFKFTGHKNPLQIIGHLQGLFVPSSRFSAETVWQLKQKQRLLIKWQCIAML